MNWVVQDRNLKIFVKKMFLIIEYLRTNTEAYIPLTVVERTPRCRRKTKGANFLSSIWLPNLDVVAVDTEGFVL